MLRCVASARIRLPAAVGLPQDVAPWTLTMLREKLVKIGAEVITHARYVIFQVAEVAVPLKLFAAIGGPKRAGCLPDEPADRPKPLPPHSSQPISRAPCAKQARVRPSGLSTSPGNGAQQPRPARGSRRRVQRSWSPGTRAR